MLNDRILRKIEFLLKCANNRCANGDIPDLKVLSGFLLGVIYALETVDALIINYDTENEEYVVEVYKNSEEPIQIIRGHFLIGN